MVARTIKLGSPLKLDKLCGFGAQNIGNLGVNGSDHTK